MAGAILLINPLKCHRLWEMPCPEQGATQKGHQMAECGFWRCFREKASPGGSGEGQHCNLPQEAGEGSSWRNRWSGTGYDVGHESEVRSWRTWEHQGKGPGFQSEGATDSMAGDMCIWIG